MTLRRWGPVALALSLVCSTAAAQRSGAATARELFRVAQAEMKRGEIDAACSKFAEAQRLDPNVGYLVNLARCNEKRDRLADARESWQNAIDLAKARNDPRLADVIGGLEALDPQVPRVVLRTSAESPAPGLVIQRDDVTLTPASLDVPLPLNPGRHVISASAPGREPWTKEIVVARGDPPVYIDIPDLPPRTAEPKTPRPEGDVSRPRGSTQRTLGLISGGVGIAAAGVGTFFALRASSLNDRSAASCDSSNACLSEGVALRNDAFAAADVATVAAIAAGVFLVGGVVLYMTAPSKAKPSTTSVLRF
jgi:tetratricopeptide (TPR) repeat protein